MKDYWCTRARFPTFAAAHAVCIQKFRGKNKFRSETVVVQVCADDVSGIASSVLSIANRLRKHAVMIGIKSLAQVPDIAQGSTANSTSCHSVFK